MFFCDISEFQVPVNDSYPYKWLAFRAFDGEHVDLHYGANLNWAERAKSGGRLDGYTVYFVYEPGFAHIAKLNELNVPVDCTVMIDVENWEGRIRGDHSEELSQLANNLAIRQGSESRVWVYANESDFAGLFPNRPSWLGTVVASWSGVKPNFPHLVAWQYTSGPQSGPPGAPVATAPFGACDHNILLTPQTPGDELTPEDKAWLKQTIRDEIVAVATDPNHTYWPGLDRKLSAGFNIAIDYNKLAALVAAKIVIPAGALTPDQVKAAVKAALKEGVQ